MKHKFTIKNLKEFSDDQILRVLLTERMSTLNPYCPLCKRLHEIYWGKKIKVTED